MTYDPDMFLTFAGTVCPDLFNRARSAASKGWTVQVACGCDEHAPLTDPRLLLK